ncbi:NAD(P)H-binding protein [Saccharopolyspora elongata]|uniref:NmrA family transcriptional regulator n=1 Tax=Saccharopolyspora elongata TaxID=2530387 RepID=A0A4R4XVF8_9PSEU|nr:NAD(P)H-binding protein [Saccharopolyspora elongata]TDD35435.1 NmrA family transcriptional regulator [Saccharopolyspora elongata]
MTNKAQKTALVLGGTGRTGRRVAAGLAAKGIPVRIGSRSATPRFDWEDRSTWEPVLSDVESAYVSFQPDLAIPGAAEAVGSFAELAVRNGVRRLVLLSGRGEVGSQRAEQAVQESGAEWTVVRASWFHQNFSEDFLVESVRAGEVVLPVDGVAEPFVDAEDIAEVAVAVLTEDGHAGKVYEVTGPRLITFAEAIGEIAAATGREIEYLPVTVEQFSAGMVEQGVPAEVVAMLGHLFTEVLDGRNAHLADGVRRALGREPRDFRDYAKRTAPTGVWS